MDVGDGAEFGGGDNEEACGVGEGCHHAVVGGRLHWYAVMVALWCSGVMEKVLLLLVIFIVVVVMN